MDPIRTAIMTNRFTAIVEEASAILHRTAHTTFVKLVQDYQCALATPAGDMVAYPSQSGVNSFIGLSLETVLDRFGREKFVPGDCLITNDPFSTDGLVTHMMDVTMIRPIFHGDRLMAFAWSFVHASDIGGGVPGSISPSFTEVFQEGIRLRPMKLYSAGVLSENVKHIIMDNSRIPDEIWGDFEAMLTAMKSMDRRLNELCMRYGADAVCTSMDDVIALGEEKARSVIAGIPDGSYNFADYLEGIKEGQFAYLHTTMTVRGEEVEFDFAGTDPQIPAAYNFVIGERTHPYVVQALLFYILTIEPDAPKNAGLLRPIRNKAPRGTVVNAEFPAAGGARVAASTRVYDTILGCLNLAVERGATAAGPGMSAIIVVGAQDPNTGRNRVSVINPLCGGGGGRWNGDGVDAIDTRSGYLKSVPTEIIEVETVMFVRACQIVVDSQSAGRFRGGAALRLELENTGLEATMTVRGMNRFYFRPWGVRGGEAGRKGEVILNPDTAKEKSIGKINVLVMKRGDVVRLTTPAGGGFGRPVDRDPKLVAADVRWGIVSAEHAASAYGVVCPAGKIDIRGTESRRAAMLSALPAAPPLFTFGPERDAIDRIWPEAERQRLAMRVLAEEPAVRHMLLAAVLNRLTGRGNAVTMAELDHVLDEELVRLSGRQRATKKSSTSESVEAVG